MPLRSCACDGAHAAAVGVVYQRAAASHAVRAVVGIGELQPVSARRPLGPGQRDAGQWVPLPCPDNCSNMPVVISVRRTGLPLPSGAKSHSSSQAAGTEPVLPLSSIYRPSADHCIPSTARRLLSSVSRAADCPALRPQ